MLSDLDLIKAFVQDSIQKKEVLLSNSSLRAQAVYGINELKAKNDGIIATSQLNNSVCEFFVHGTSSYWELINEGLAEYNYILKGQINSRGFYQYQYCQIPKKYRMHCTKSVMLWRAWWKHRKNTFQTGIPLDLMIRTRDSWYPIRDLSISDGLIYIKTLGNEITIHAEDLITWLNKVDGS